MAITVIPQILGQQADSTNSYCYLYEPLRVFIKESASTASKLYIDVALIDTSTGSTVSTSSKFVNYDIIPSVGITIDLMKVVLQIHDANIYKFGSVADMTNNLIGWKSVLSSYKYKFTIYSDVSTTSTIIYKTPINGGRNIEQFTAAVSQSQSVNEFEYYGLDESELRHRWSGVSLPTVSLACPTTTSVRPTISQITNSGDAPCGGFLIWKSRFGGWMWWGFNLKTETPMNSYNGNLEVGMFESTLDSAGSIYVPVNYTGLNTSYKKTLRAFDLTTDELKAVSGIHASPAIYYQYPVSKKLELMRLASFSAPISTLIDGGEFSVTLQSISNTSQLAI